MGVVKRCVAWHVARLARRKVPNANPQNRALGPSRGRTSQTGTHWKKCWLYALCVNERVPTEAAYVNQKRHPARDQLFWERLARGRTAQREGAAAIVSVALPPLLAAQCALRGGQQGGAVTLGRVSTVLVSSENRERPPLTPSLILPSRAAKAPKRTTRSPRLSPMSVRGGGTFHTRRLTASKRENFLAKTVVSRRLVRPLALCPVARAVARRLTAAVERRGRTTATGCTRTV